VTALLALSTPSSALALLADIQQALEKCDDLAEVRELRGQAEAVRHYLKSASTGLELLNRAAIVKLLCERRAGAILGRLVKRGGNRRGNGSLPTSRLEQLGIKNRMQSSRLQKVASVSEEEFRQYVNRHLCEEKEVTTQGLLRFAQERCRKSRSVEKDMGDLSLVSDGLRTLARQRKQFHCVYASPVWGKCRKVKATELAKWLSELPVTAVAAPDAHAHLAVPPEMLRDGIAILDKWGFRFKGELVRPTPSGDFGDYWQRAHTSILLGVRGRLAFRDTGLPSFMDDHDFFGNGDSTKIHSLIARVSPPPYLDLLADKTLGEWISPRSTGSSGPSLP
jgi:hypothetical protein